MVRRLLGFRFPDHFAAKWSKVARGVKQLSPALRDAVGRDGVRVHVRRRSQALAGTLTNIHPQTQTDTHTHTHTRARATHLDTHTHIPSQII